MKKRISAIILSALLTASLLMGGCQSRAIEDKKPAEIVAEESTAESKKEMGNAVFGEFTSVTQSGEEVTQDIFSGADLNMVNIWGTFCGPCIGEMPDLGELADAYSEKGVAIIGLISDVQEAGNETAQEIIDRTGADYTHIVLSEELYDNFLWQVQVVPTTIFVDKDGVRVGDVIMGAKDKESWIKEIDARLEEIKGAEN